MAENTERSEEELVDLTDDELEQHLTGEAGAEPETKTTDEPQNVDASDDSSEEKSEKDEGTKEESSDPEKVDKEDLPEGFEKFTANEKALYHERKEERRKRQEWERQATETRIELERVKAAHEASLKAYESMNKKPEQGQPVSKYQEVYSKIQAKASQYEEQYGEEYRPSLAELNALEQAKEEDFRVQQQTAQARQNSERQQQALNGFMDQANRAESEFKEKLKAENGEDDYEHVFKSFVEPMIMQEIQSQGDSPTLKQIMRSKNPAEATYSMMTLHPEGRKYYESKIFDRAKRNLAKNVIDETNKKTPTTSAVAEGGRASDGRTQVTPQMLSSDDSWLDKLNDDQIEALTSRGESVYI